MFIKTHGQYTAYDAGGRRIALRCPSCLKQGVLDSIGIHDAAPSSAGTPVFGQRRCPNPQCGLHIFFIQYQQGGIVSFPPERLDFDANDIPKPIVAAFTEAISCHALECYMAAALMVRRTLEELCKDRSATGANLKDRITNLGSKVVLPVELLQALDDIRLLGNDAAHVESQDYNQVGKEEVEIAVEFAKEVLKAVYQYSGLLNRLKLLKKQRGS